MADQAHRYISDQAESTDNRSVISKFSVAVDLHEVRAEVFHVIKEVRPLRMARELYPLVRREVLHRKLLRSHGDLSAAMEAHNAAPCRYAKRTVSRPQIRSTDSTNSRSGEIFTYGLGRTRTVNRPGNSSSKTISADPLFSSIIGWSLAAISSGACVESIRIVTVRLKISLTRSIG